MIIHKHKYSTLACGCVMCNCGHIKKGCYNNPIEKHKTTPKAMDWEKEFDKIVLRFVDDPSRQANTMYYGREFIKDLLARQKREIFQELNESVPEEECCKVCDIITSEATGVRLPFKDKIIKKNL